MVWHCFFGLPDSVNDVNVLKISHLLAKIASADAPACNFTTNGHGYVMGYYLADDINPSWSTFLNTISNPHGRKEAPCQEACRKDIERALVRCSLVCYCLSSCSIMEQ